MALFVGPKHSGKTVAACSWNPTRKRVKVLDGDGRIRGLLGASWIDLSLVDYDYYPPTMVTNDKSFFDRVNDDCEVIQIELEQRKSAYGTYIADSATAFCKNLIMDSIPLTHEGKKGKRIGTMEMPGPSDYGFESVGFDQYLTFLRSIPIHVIVTAHLVDKFDKPRLPDGSKDTYAENIIVGQKLSLRDKISANCTIYFDHIFEFSRAVVGNEEKFYVEYISNIACTSFAGLKPGRHDITGKDFYAYTMGLLKK